MDCLKCGKATEENNVFCPECLAVMDRYPVRQDTAVVLPQRKPRERREQKKLIKPEEMISQLQLKVKRLWITVAVLLLLLGLSGGGLSLMLYQEWTEPEIGSNYSTYASTEETGQNR